MSRLIKRILNLSIGLANAERTDDFEFEVDNNATEQEINDTIKEYWRDWIWNFIDGGWDITSDQKIE